MTRLLLVGVAVLLASCGGLSSKTATTVTYQLRAAPVNQPGSPPSTAAAAVPSRLAAFSLQVLQPVAGPGFESDAILLTAPDHRLDRYALSRWSAPAPRLLASLAVETLRNRAVFAAIHDDTTPFPSDYILRISVRRFDADYGNNAGTAPRINVVLDCSLGTRGDRKLLQSFTADAVVSATDNRMSAVIAAFETATRAALDKLAEQAIVAVSADTVSN